MAHGTVDWFQIDADDPDGAERFYGELFSWTFAADPNGGGAYRLARRAGTDAPIGGVADTRGESPNRAMIMVVVDDVATTVEQAERLGGKVDTPLVTTPNGLTFAKLRDPAGNTIGVYRPPSA